MSNSSSLPGVHVDESRIKDFLDGIYGSNKKSNKRAYAISAVVVAALAISNTKSKRAK